ISALVQGGCALDLQDKVIIHVPDVFQAGSTPLHLACQNGHAQSARVLLLGGSVPDIKNKVGDTCLHIAARYNHVVVVKILLGAFCSVAEKNQVGDTALHVAAALNHKKTVSLLLEAGADCSIKNNVDIWYVQRFTRGRTVRKRRDVLRAQRRAQSVPRDEVLPGKVRIIYNTKKHHKRTASKRKRDSTSCLAAYVLIAIVVFLQCKLSHCYNNRIRIKTSEHYCNYTRAFLYYGTIIMLLIQAPANGCNCKPLIKKLEHQLKATKKEMRSQIHMVQEQMNCKLGRIDCQSKQQIKVLEKMTQERVSAERMECRYRINQRATLERTENQTRQVVVKNWCMSKLQEMEVQLPAESGYYKLVQSPSTDHSVLETDPERLPLLSVISADSGSSLATYVNLLPNPAATGSAGKSPEFDDLQGRKYFEVKLDGSPSRPTCLSGIDPEPSRLQAWHHRKHLRDRIRAHRANAQPGSTLHTLEFFTERPPEPSFIQERANLHAVEVTQRFFETVSTQLERWYERKIQEAQRAVEHRAQQDRAGLLQRIDALEEELRRLRARDFYTDSLQKT
uniref:Ankyrin repeat domain 6a n=1 Tax=Astyanax mexicanus TaxID=7994 RepID=A0A8B9K8S9_ASTMX